jgi:hypothetical protein
LSFEWLKGYGTVGEILFEQNTADISELDELREAMT